MAVLLLLVACNLPRYAAPTVTPTNTPNLTPSPIPATSLPSPSPTPALPAEWVEALPGLDVREMPIPAESGSPPALAALVRIDPARFAVRVSYDPDHPAAVVDWQARAAAPVVINAGFFQKDHTSAGLLISDGHRFGLSFDPASDPLLQNAGMFSVTGGAVAIRALAQTPTPDRNTEQAVQGLPMLIDGGLPVDFHLPDRKAWRTVIAVDRQERIVLINVSRGEITLYQLRDWLAATGELDLSAALNLDGGPSAGLALIAGRWTLRFDSVSQVPSVLAVYPK